MRMGRQMCLRGGYQSMRGGSTSHGVGVFVPWLPLHSLAASRTGSKRFAREGVLEGPGGLSPRSLREADVLIEPDAVVEGRSGRSDGCEPEKRTESRGGK